MGEKEDLTGWVVVIKYRKTQLPKKPNLGLGAWVLSENPILPNKAKGAKYGL